MDLSDGPPPGQIPIIKVRGRLRGQEVITLEAVNFNIRTCCIHVMITHNSDLHVAFM